MDDLARERFTLFMGGGTFDAHFQGLEPLEVAGGKARAKLTVSPSLQNLGGTLHGGAMASLVDLMGTIAIMSADREGRPGVTTDLNLTCCAPVPGGSVVLIEARVLRPARASS